jgi:hypothetical protein
VSGNGIKGIVNDQRKRDKRKLSAITLIPKPDPQSVPHK